MPYIQVGCPFYGSVKKPYGVNRFVLARVETWDSSIFDWCYRTVRGSLSCPFVLADESRSAKRDRPSFSTVSIRSFKLSVRTVSRHAPPWYSCYSATTTAYSCASYFLFAVRYRATRPSGVKVAYDTVKIMGSGVRIPPSTVRVALVFRSPVLNSVTLRCHMLRERYVRSVILFSFCSGRPYCQVSHTKLIARKYEAFKTLHSTW